MRRTRIRRKARLLRQVGRCGEAVTSVDWTPAPEVQEAFLRARLTLTGLALELGHDLADVRAGLDGAP